MLKEVEHQLKNVKKEKIFDYNEIKVNLFIKKSNIVISRK